MGSDSGRQPGARSPSTLRIPPAPGSPSNPRNPALPRVGCPWPEQPWSRSQLGREGGGGASIRLPWGDLAPHHPQHTHTHTHTHPTHGLTAKPSCLNRQAIKRMETRDGVSRQLEYLLKNVISFYFPSPGPLLPPYP